MILLSGFVFVAPVLAMGLCSISRQLERGRQPFIARCLVEKRKVFGNVMVFALALLIVGMTAIGFVTAPIGLAVTIPVLGHATWHACRDTIDASAWPANDA